MLKFVSKHCHKLKMADSPTSKRKKLKENLNDGLIDKFLKWCEDVGLTLSKKVTVREDGCCHRFGMIAVNKLEEGECIFKIPRSLLLEPKTSSISEIVEELNSQVAENTERHQWLPLLVTLLYEYTNPASKWRPYLDLVPDKETLNQPIFWNKLEREYLNLIEMKENVDSDIKCIEEQYYDYVIPFIKKHVKYFDTKIHTLELYKHLAGFVMAYSFTDYSPEELSAVPAMVPMADILNHVSDNNAHLEFGEDCLSMVTTQTIEKGGEIFNTYGQLDNHNLLRSYGFNEDSPNPYDEVQIPMKVFKDVLKLTDDQWKTKISDFKEQSADIYNENGLLFCVNGCLYYEERLHQLFQVFHRDTITRVNTTSSPAVGHQNVGEDNFNQNNNLQKGNSSFMKDVIEHNERNLETFVDHKKNPSSNNRQLIEEKWESDWESETEDELDSSDESIENNSEEDQEGHEWDSNSHSSDEDATNNLVTYKDLHCLPLEWRQTLSSAAKICAGKVMESSMEFSCKSNVDQINRKREDMVKNILHGQLSILKQVEQLQQS